MPGTEGQGFGVPWVSNKHSERRTDSQSRLPLAANWYNDWTATNGGFAGSNPAPSDHFHRSPCALATESPNPKPSEELGHFLQNLANPHPFETPSLLISS